MTHAYTDPEFISTLSLNGDNHEIVKAKFAQDFEGSTFLAVQYIRDEQGAISSIIVTYR